MGEIAPRLSQDELGALGPEAPLPGVTADAHIMDPDAHATNRELAKQIRDLFAKMKPSDGDVPRFILAWRMYPNAASKHWDSGGTEHVCGCGCGDSMGLP